MEGRACSDTVFRLVPDSSLGRAGPYRNYVVSIPLWVSKVHQGRNGDEKIEREFEDFEIGTAHGCWRQEAEAASRRCLDALVDTK